MLDWVPYTPLMKCKALEYITNLSTGSYIYDVPKNNQFVTPNHPPTHYIQEKNNNRSIV